MATTFPSSAAHLRARRDPKQVRVPVVGIDAWRRTSRCSSSSDRLDRRGGTILNDDRARRVDLPLRHTTKAGVKAAPALSSGNTAAPIEPAGSPFQSRECFVASRVSPPSPWSVGAACSSEQETTPPHRERRMPACTADADCVIVSNPCGTPPTASRSSRPAAQRDPARGCNHENDKPPASRCGCVQGTSIEVNGRPTTGVFGHRPKGLAGAGAGRSSRQMMQYAERHGSRATGRLARSRFSCSCLAAAARVVTRQRASPAISVPARHRKKTEAECKVEGDKSGRNVSRGRSMATFLPRSCDSQPACALFTRGVSDGVRAALSLAATAPPAVRTGSRQRSRNFTKRSPCLASRNGRRDQHQGLARDGPPPQRARSGKRCSRRAPSAQSRSPWTFPSGPGIGAIGRRVVDDHAPGTPRSPTCEPRTLRRSCG